MATTEELAEKLNSLLRGELSSVETYQQAIERVGNDLGGRSYGTSRTNTARR
jgi:hypothetical protein